jgi:hypothetical protein
MCRDGYRVASINAWLEAHSPGLISSLRVMWCLSEGCKGFVVGLGHGVIGVVAKPVVGTLDAVTHASEGFKAVAMVRSEEERRV